MRLLPAILLAATGCQAPPAEKPQPSQGTVNGAKTAPVPSPSDTPPATAIATLEGEWRVAGIDGAALDETYGIALTGSARELWWEPRCAFVVRSYRIDGAAIVFGPALGAPKPGEMPPPVCTIAPPPRMGDILRALDAATTVSRTPQNGVLISGRGRSVLLFSQ